MSNNMIKPSWGNMFVKALISLIALKKKQKTDGTDAVVCSNDVAKSLNVSCKWGQLKNADCTSVWKVPTFL